MINYSNNLLDNNHTIRNHKDQPIKTHSYDIEATYNNPSWYNIPFSVSSFCSIISLFMMIRAIAINGFIVDHSLWGGSGHHYDQHPIVSLNRIELILIIMSFCLGMIIWILLIVKSKFYQTSISNQCQYLSITSVLFTLLSLILFYNRTLGIIVNNDNYVYSRGFYSCLVSGIFMTLTWFGFFLDWKLELSCNEPISPTLKALLIPSMMASSIIMIGSISFMYIEGWEYNESMLFCATILTTVGYGDTVPKTSTGRFLFCFYAMIGICIIGYFFLSLRAVMINGSSDNLIMKVNLMRMESINNFAHEHYYSYHSKYKQQQQYQYQRLQPVYTESTPIIHSLSKENNNTMNSYYKRQPQSNFIRHHKRYGSNSGFSTFSYNHHHHTFEPLFKDKKRQVFVNIITHSGVSKMSIIFLINWFLGSAIFYLLENKWSYSDALYFTFVTQLTIGFGDLVPETALAQEFWFIYIIISIAVAAYFVSLFGNILAEKLLIGDDTETINDNNNDIVENNDDDFDNDNNHYLTINDGFHFKDINNTDLVYNNTMTAPVRGKSNNYVKLSKDLFIKESSVHPTPISSPTNMVNKNDNENNDDDGNDDVYLSENDPLVTFNCQQQQSNDYHYPLRSRSKTLPTSITSAQPNSLLRNDHGSLHINAYSGNKKKHRRILSSRKIPIAAIFRQGNNQNKQ
ncbi:unnamed protein product [Cunninghamella blakesleeana]